MMNKNIFVCYSFSPMLHRIPLWFSDFSKHVQRNPEAFQVFPVYDHALPNQAIIVLIIWNSNFDES